MRKEGRILKQTRKNRVLAMLLAVAMLFQMLPLMAFAAEGEGTAAVAWIGETGYPTIQEAVRAAKSGDTITLGEGNYTLYKTSSEGMTKGKDLTFVGQGTEKTAWNIGAEVPDPANYGTEYNGDYSFDGAGTVTFRNMTLRSGKADYLGFIRADNTVVENCVINGKTFYWGYKSATFKDTTFNAPSGDYALWTYSSPVMTFEGCTFNSTGKVINVYTDACAGKNDIEVNLNSCTVNSTGVGKAALNINDSNMGDYKYILRISGGNITAARSNITCTQMFGFSKAANNTGRADVHVDDKLVWSEGKMLTHAYTDGEKDNKVKPVVGDWTEDGDHYTRTITSTCEYCGWTKTENETGYKLTYDLNGGAAAEGENYGEAIAAKVVLAKAPTREGYTFTGWKDAAETVLNAGEELTLTANTTLTAQWKETVPEQPEPPEGPDTPADDGDAGAAVILGVGATVLGYYAGTAIFKRLFGLPYWPYNRGELAMLLWEDAGKPMPESSLLYPDLGEEEQDMDMQHAARWAMENELLPDLNRDEDRTEEEKLFFPYHVVSRIRILHTWQKAQELKKNA